MVNIELPKPTRLRRPNVGPSLAWVGPLLMVVSVLVGWFAFASAGGTVALGLYVGAAAIVLMAWSFLLAIRLPVFEPLFGGLDSAYRAHRWAGTLAVPAMFLHARIEPEVDNGIRGAARALAESGEDLAGVAEYGVYALIALSLLRWIPYRFWRLTHKLFGIPFALASFHFVTATKTYANNSPWGWYFGAFMVAGLVAWVVRVVGRDMIFPGSAYRVAEVSRHGITTELVLEPKGRGIRHEVGQFAVIKLQRPGMREPHIFTIASPPTDDRRLRFYIRNLGDWTEKIQSDDLVGADVIVEGPYGRFEPFAHGASDTTRPVWIAGGVGITPFLAATAALEPQPAERRPRLLYCVPKRAEATAIEELTLAHDEGRIMLTVMASDEGNRLRADNLVDTVGAPGIAGAHVAICGPKGLVADMHAAARAAGAANIETEDFDIRGGVGPDLSRPVDAAIDKVRSRS